MAKRLRPPRTAPLDWLRHTQRAIYARESAEDVLRYLRDQVAATFHAEFAALDDAQRRALVEWARSLTPTNCGWAAYELGGLVLAAVGGRSECRVIR